MNKSELEYIVSVLSHREFKHFCSVELNEKEFNAKGTDWAIEQALSNFDSDQIGEYNDGEHKLPWGSYSVFEHGKKVTIHVFYDVYRYLVIDVNSLAVVFDTDFLTDAREYINEDHTNRIVYDTKEKMIYRHIIKEY